MTGATTIEVHPTELRRGDFYYSYVPRDRYTVVDVGPVHGDRVAVTWHSPGQIKTCRYDVRQLLTVQRPNTKKER